MTFPVLLRRAALAEFDAAADWYEARSPGRGAAFTVTVRQTLAEIASRPNAYPIVRADIRDVIVSG